MNDPKPRAKTGPKLIDGVTAPTKKYMVTLDAKTVEIAKRLGSGQISAGLRIAAKMAGPAS
ncbi:hypothetical protein [Nevskia ramosa]|uniref:hypothetical protein n=1 Tax=Nevskia ramosa TaxID=64002 RepID=UPI003D0A2F56